MAQRTYADSPRASDAQKRRHCDRSHANCPVIIHLKAVCQLPHGRVASHGAVGGLPRCPGSEQKKAGGQSPKHGAWLDWREREKPCGGCFQKNAATDLEWRSELRPVSRKCHCFGTTPRRTTLSENSSCAALRQCAVFVCDAARCRRARGAAVRRGGCLPPAHPPLGTQLAARRVRRSKTALTELCSCRRAAKREGWGWLGQQVERRASSWVIPPALASLALSCTRLLAQGTLIRSRCEAQESLTEIRAFRAPLGSLTRGEQRLIWRRNALSQSRPLTLRPAPPLVATYRLLQRLRDQGAGLQWRDNKARTPLHVAIQGGHMGAIYKVTISLAAAPSGAFPQCPA